MDERCAYVCVFPNTSCPFKHAENPYIIRYGRNTSSHCHPRPRVHYFSHVYYLYCANVYDIHIIICTRVWLYYYYFECFRFPYFIRMHTTLDPSTTTFIMLTPADDTLCLSYIRVISIELWNYRVSFLSTILNIYSTRVYYNICYIPHITRQYTSWPICIYNMKQI